MVGVGQGGWGDVWKGERKYVGSKYQGGKKIEREKGTKRSPTEYRNQEAVAQMICMNWAVGEKRKRGEGLKERCEDGVLRQWFCQGGQFIWSQAYLQIHPVMKGWRSLFRTTGLVKLIPATGPGAWKSPSERTDLCWLSFILLGCHLKCTVKEEPEEGCS